MNQQLQDSGKRRTFKSGAVRDRGDLKPRPDLISPHAQMREGMIFTLGAEKYDIRNWEKGMEISECLASAQRHIEQYKRGDQDEDHIAQARWNLGAIIHFEEEIKAGRLDPTLDDMPAYRQQAPIYVMENLPPVQILTDPLLIENNQYMQPFYCLYERTIANDKPTFYICGPMRGKKDLNFPLFDEVAKYARDMGFSVISPAELDRANGIDPVNNPNGIVEVTSKAHPNFIQTIVQRDCNVITKLNKNRGDGLILLPGWEKSTGCRAEVSLALWLGLKFKLFRYEGDGKIWDAVLKDINSLQIKRQLFHQFLPEAE